MTRVNIYRMRGGVTRKLFDGRLARTWLERLRGLLGTPALTDSEALIITPCSSVHTLGMRYAIDVAFLDKDNRVIKCCENVSPRAFSGAWRGRIAMETAAGALRKADIQKGDRLYWHECPEHIG